jgi:LPS-assembly protein
MGTATGASLAFKGVPFFYWPYFTYPVTDDRRSGLLFPKIGSSDKRGFEYSQPIYWNIRPNMDATFVPRYMEDRGTQLGTEYRFLTQKNAGVFWGDFLPDDDKYDEDRWQYELETESYLPFGWRGRIDAAGVSDDQYFEDMSSSLGETSQVALSREGIVEYYDTTWSAFIKVQDYQTVDPFLTDDDDPYMQAPQVSLDGMWYGGLLGANYGFESESVYFTKDDSVKGLRTNIRPVISRPFRYGGLYMVPEAAFDYTVYDLEDQPTDQSSNPDRAAPILTLDTGAVFERLSGSKQQSIVTFEPRALYTYIPERNQDDLPVFDTILADFNLIQLFEPNRYIGYDRLGDANQFAIGITSRVLDANTGREKLTATIGQERLVESSEVILPGEEPSNSRKSNYIAEIGVHLSPKWSAVAEYQLDAEERETEKASTRLRFMPGPMKAINLGYRYTRESLEQTDVSFAWPLGKHWNALGRYNYSIEDSEVLDEYLGIEYSSCCWGIRMLGRRSVERSSGDQSESISVQFVLKGLAGFGSQSGESLRHGILRD